MRNKPLAIGAITLSLFWTLMFSGCAQNDNGPSTVHNSATDAAKKNPITPAEQAAIENNPRLPAATKAAILGRFAGGQGALPPQIAARQAKKSSAQ